MKRRKAVVLLSGGIDSSTTLAALIVSCAMPGDTIRNMSRLGNNPFYLMLSPSFGVEWDAVLLSAGGNDLLADIRRITRAETLITSRWSSLSTGLREGIAI